MSTLLRIGTRVLGRVAEKAAVDIACSLVSAAGARLAARRLGKAISTAAVIPTGRYAPPDDDAEPWLSGDERDWLADLEERPGLRPSPLVDGTTGGHELSPLSVRQLIHLDAKSFEEVAIGTAGQLDLTVWFQNVEGGTSRVNHALAVLWAADADALTITVLHHDAVTAMTLVQLGWLDRRNAEIFPEANVEDLSTLAVVRTEALNGLRYLDVYKGLALDFLLDDRFDALVRSSDADINAAGRMLDSLGSGAPD